MLSTLGRYDPGGGRRVRHVVTPCTTMEKGDFCAWRHGVGELNDGGGRYRRVDGSVVNEWCCRNGGMTAGHCNELLLLPSTR